MRREHHVNPSASSTSRYANSVRRTQVQCELCHSWLSNRYALKAHMLRHTSEPKKCPQCDKISPNANALSSHIREVHAERIHKCHLCEKAFKAAVALKVTKRIRVGLTFIVLSRLFGCSVVLMTAQARSLVQRSKFLLLVFVFQFVSPKSAVFRKKVEGIVANSVIFRNVPCTCVRRNGMWPLWTSFEMN